MQKEKVMRVGIVGWGFIGKVHTYGYINLPLFYQPPAAQIHLVGVCTVQVLVKKNFFLESLQSIRDYKKHIIRYKDEDNKEF